MDALLPFPVSLIEFQHLFPSDAACAAYIEQARWAGGFTCPHCGAVGEPFRFENRPGVLRCRSCRKDTSLIKGTVMQHSHIPLTTWFWAAYLTTSETTGISTVQFQRQMGLSRYETAHGLIRKLRAAMERPDRIGFRLNHRISPFKAFRSLLGIDGDTAASAFGECDPRADNGVEK